MAVFIFLINDSLQITLLTKQYKRQQDKRRQKQFHGAWINAIFRP